MSRYECPVCEENSVITIHDTMYICDAGDCGVVYNPQADDLDPTYPKNGGIGFCPKCGTNAREEQDSEFRELFQCPSCGHEWYDGRVDGVTLAQRFEVRDVPWF